MAASRPRTLCRYTANRFDALIMRKYLTRLITFISVAVASFLARRFFNHYVYRSCHPGESCPLLRFIDGPEGTLVAVFHMLSLLILGCFLLFPTISGSNEKKHGDV